MEVTKPQLLRAGADSVDSEVMDMRGVLVSLDKSTLLTTQLDLFTYFRVLASLYTPQVLQSIRPLLSIETFPEAAEVPNPSTRLYVLLNGRVSSSQGNSVQIGNCLLDIRTEKLTPEKFTCVTTCLFAVCEKDAFLRIIDHAEGQKTNDFVKFVGKLPFFKHWSNTALMKICKVFVTVEIHKNTVLYREGSPINDLFIVKSGEIGLTKELISPEDRMEPKGSPRKRQVTVSILGPGELLGVEEIGATRSHTAVCRSLLAVLYRITVSDFQRYVMQSEGWERSQTLLATKVALRDKLYQRLARPVRYLELPQVTSGVSRQSPKTERHSFVASPSVERSVDARMSPQRRVLLVPHLSPFPRPTPPQDLVHYPNADVTHTYSHHRYPRRIVKVKSKTARRVTEIGLGEAVSHSRYHFIQLSGDMEPYLHPGDPLGVPKVQRSVQRSEIRRDISLQGKRYR